MKTHSHTASTPREATANNVCTISKPLRRQIKTASVTASQKRILLITADGDPGGGVTNALQLCKALKKSGEWHVTLCSQVNSHLIRQAESICDDVHKIEFFRSRFDPTVRWKIRALIRKLSPDLIHTHGSRAALPTVCAIGPGGPPIIHTVHGFHFHQKLWLSRYFAIKAERRIARDAQKIIFVCNNDKQIADQNNILIRARSNITIHHGVDTGDLPQKVLGPQPTVVMLARLVYQKHPEMLIEIADRLRNEGILFRFIGTGPLEVALQKEVERRNLQDIVIFSGSHSREKALQLAATASLAILPSRWEGFPISLLELLGMGIPVIAARVNGIPEAITHGFNGFLISNANPQTYAQQIRRLIHSKDLRSRLSRNGRNAVALDFNEARMADAHLDLYQQTIVERSRLNSAVAMPAQRIAEHPQTVSTPA